MKTQFSKLQLTVVGAALARKAPPATMVLT